MLQGTLFRKTADYYGATKACQSIDGELLTIGSAEENQAALEFNFDGHLLMTEYPVLMLGPRFKGDPRQLEGTKGEKGLYSRFHPVEPNNVGGVENCIELWTYDAKGAHTGLWNDVSCDTTRHMFVCERPSGDFPAETTTKPPKQATLAKPSDQKCPEGWIHMDAFSKCYKPFAEASTYEEAAKKCGLLNSELLTIESWQENNAVAELKVDGELFRKQWVRLWLGPRFQKNTRMLLTPKNEPVHYTNFYSNNDYAEPNNVNDSEYCIEFWKLDYKEPYLPNRNFTKTWNDVSCDGELDAFICELHL
ncbi:unnamed protein product, partial [Mesorhabditis spiculigera]